MIIDLHTNQVVALIISGVASVSDFRTRRIPNTLTFGGTALGFVYAAATGHGGGILGGVEGWALGFAMFLPMFLLGGMGAGDVKLLACLGAWMGPQQTFAMALYSMIAGGVLGIAVGLATGYLRQAFRNIWALLAYWRVMGIRPLEEVSLAGSKGPRLPYAIPIAAGAVWAILLH
jgi:prepilin peptidase CpaA